MTYDINASRVPVGLPPLAGNHETSRGSATARIAATRCFSVVAERTGVETTKLTFGPKEGDEIYLLISDLRTLLEGQR